MHTFMLHTKKIEEIIHLDMNKEKNFFVLFYLFTKNYNISVYNLTYSS